ncbi:arginase family protein [Synechococcus sp. PCC 7336]|uniref:arginase family protein n=1 Tax=Synechococcus sp. PCC 7336 TaxID=195250 RepID=UPI000347BBB5|nr:arginase family protein [Synechococcus sp. PCC 7336]
MAQWSSRPARLEFAKAAIVPVICDARADLPAAIVAAGDRLCGFEPQLDLDVDAYPVARLSAIRDEAPFGMSEAAFRTCFDTARWPLLVPSSLAATRGAVRALWKRYGPLTLLHCSARAGLLPPEPLADDMAESWLESVESYDPAIVHVGLRSCSASAWQWLQTRQTPVFLASDWTLEAAIAALPSERPVFLAIDCSVFDPSLVAAVPHPEPGGLQWQQLADLCRELFANRTVVGAAIGGLRGESGLSLSVRVTARTIGWLLACHFASSAPTSVSPASESGTVPVS